MSAENGKIHQTATKLTTTTASKSTINPMPLNVKREPGTMPPSYIANGALGPQLTSLKPKRDLTLGGRGGVNSNANKKVFTPNLNVERKKNSNVKTSKDTTRGARGGRGGRGERGGRGGARGGRGGNSSLIQTTGVFSEGAGAVNIRRAAAGGGGGGSYGRSADDSVSAMRKPILVKNELKKIDLKAEAAQMHELLGDSDDEYYELPENKTDLAQVPIKLNEAKWKFIKTDIKVEPNVCNGGTSSSSIADDASTLAVAQKMQSLAVQQQQNQLQQDEQIQSTVLRYPQSVEELLHATQPQIFLMQLPDTLPCEDEEIDNNDKPEKTTDTEMPSTSNAAGAATLQLPTSQTRQRKTHTLKNMEEGQVGKLLRYKSGKIKLVLGESYFDIDMGMETGFLQDLMSISANREERSGNMINLGPIQAKLTATPDWEQLLRQQQQQV